MCDLAFGSPLTDDVMAFSLFSRKTSAGILAVAMGVPRSPAQSVTCVPAKRDTRLIYLTRAIRKVQYSSHAWAGASGTRLGVIPMCSVLYDGLEYTKAKG